MLDSPSTVDKLHVQCSYRYEEIVIHSHVSFTVVCVYVSAKDAYVHVHVYVYNYGDKFLGHIFA